MRRRAKKLRRFMRSDKLRIKTQKLYAIARKHGRGTWHWHKYEKAHWALVAACTAQHEICESPPVRALHDLSTYYRALPCARCGTGIVQSGRRLIRVLEVSHV